MGTGAHLMGLSMNMVCDFGVAPEAVRDARGFVAKALRDWSCHALIDVAVLLTSELVTNAILHAKTGPTVRMALNGSTLRVEVLDRGPGTPTRGSSPTDALSGRGLALVEAMSDGWGVSNVAEGKAVWFELRS